MTNVQLHGLPVLTSHLSAHSAKQEHVFSYVHTFHFFIEKKGNFKDGIFLRLEGVPKLFLGETQPHSFGDAGWLMLSPSLALVMSLDLAASRWAIWAISSVDQQGKQLLPAGVCTKIQLPSQPHDMGLVLGQIAKHTHCSLC